MGELATMDGSGDTKVIWDYTKPAEVDVARSTFNELKKKGYLAYKVRGDGSQGEVIREFDPMAQSIILSPQMQGG
jgi:hypothetical protein